MTEVIPATAPTAAPQAGRRRERRAPQAAVRQLPFARVFNRYRPTEVLSADHIEAIHRSALKLLRETGIEVMQDPARHILKHAGCDVDESTQRVRFESELIESSIAKAPASFTMRARNRAHDVGCGKGEIIFAATGGPAFAHDCDRGKRPGTYADMVDYLKVVHQLNVVHQEGGCPVEPTDLPPDSRHLDFYEAALTLTDKTWQCWALGAYRVEDAINMGGLAYGMSRAEIRQNPITLTIINSNSPLRLDIPMCEALLAMGNAMQPLAMTPFTLSGAMSPITLAGALTQQHAEAMAMLALSQINAPGTPVLYGGFTSNVDMRSGAPAFGTPEYTKAAMAGGQLARRLGVPYRSSNVTASNVVDIQASYESMMSLWGAIMGGVHLIEHAAGWMEGGLTASFEKLVLDAELLQGMREFLKPIAVNEAEMGIAAIAEVGPGGHFFGVGHTLERFQTAFYEPMLSDWRNYQSWENAGAKTGTERANAIWKELLRSYEPPPMDEGRREALAAYVAKRKEEIAKDKLVPDPGA